MVAILFLVDFISLFFVEARLGVLDVFSQEPKGLSQLIDELHRLLEKRDLLLNLRFLRGDGGL
jgi:hypothetical protein